MKFSLTKFRCFKKTTPVRIAPITLLIGENSTGKTSFMAALRATLDFFCDNAPPSFNKDPFHLGAFDQIVNRPSGSLGGGKTFSFDAELDLQSPFYARASQRLKKLRIKSIGVNLHFSKSGSQPRLTKLTFTVGKTIIVGKSTDRSMSFSFVYEGREISFDSVALKNGYYSPVENPRHLRYFVEHTIRTQRAKIPSLTPEAVKTLRLATEALFFAFWPFERRQVRAVAPMRSKPRRTYDPKEDSRDSEGEYVPYRLARLKHDNKSSYQNVKAALDKFGIASGLFDSIEIKQLGLTDSDPFQVVFRMKGTSSNLMDVGYGVSQSVPLVTDLLLHDRATYFLIQQPEVHLHPRAQAAFATFVMSFCKQTGAILVLETHSDYILDRLRSHVRSEKEFTSDDISVIYFERSSDQVKIHQINIDERGEVVDAPRSYRDFFFTEELNTLGLIDVPNN